MLLPQPRVCVPSLASDGSMCDSLDVGALRLMSCKGRIGSLFFYLFYLLQLHSARKRAASFPAIRYCQCFLSTSTNEALRKARNYHSHQIKIPMSGCHISEWVSSSPRDAINRRVCWNFVRKREGRGGCRRWGAELGRPRDH